MNLSIHVYLLSIIMFSKTKTLIESVFLIISFYLHQEIFILLEFTRIVEVNNSINQVSGSSSWIACYKSKKNENVTNIIIMKVWDNIYNTPSIAEF